ncbi:E3 ubiquitin-protein ligase TRIM32-like [Branchiostoma floridae x Branchiostoma japonicum]
MSNQGVGRYFPFIKNKVSSDWKDLAWCLGFETPDIDNIDGKHRDDKSRCMDLLQQWYKREGNAATIHVLMEALQDAELQHVVDSLKDKYPDPLPPTASKQAENIAIREEVKILKEKNEKLEKIILEQKIQQLQENNKNMEATIEKMLTSKQPVESENQQKDPLKLMSDKHCMEKSEATNQTQVKQSVVQEKRKDSGANIRSIRVGQPWMRKVKFGGEGSGRGKFQWPYGIAVSQDNEVYIADHSNKRIQVFTMDGVYIREFTTSLPGKTGKELNPHDVAVDRNGNLWVVGHDHVVQYSREGTCLAQINIPLVIYPRGITVTMATGQVIVTEYDGKKGRLQVLEILDDSEVGTYGSGHTSPKPWFPCCVTVGGEGNILVTDFNNHCVHVMDREGNFKFKFGSEGSGESQLNHPRGICVDGMKNIIVADSGNGCVKMFDSQGRFLCHIGSGMKQPWAVAVSPGGDVVVTDDKDHTVSVWTQG